MSNSCLYYFEFLKTAITIFHCLIFYLNNFCVLEINLKGINNWENCSKIAKKIKIK